MRYMRVPINWLVQLTSGYYSKETFLTSRQVPWSSVLWKIDTRQLMGRGYGQDKIAAQVIPTALAISWQFLKKSLFCSSECIEFLYYVIWRQTNFNSRCHFHCLPHSASNPPPQSLWCLISLPLCSTLQVLVFGHALQFSFLADDFSSKTCILTQFFWWL